MITDKDRQYFRLSQEIASIFSRDNSTKVGCVIVDPVTYDILSTGYNGFPRKVKEDPIRKDRPAKYVFTEHAERNAVYGAARTGTKLDGATAYTTLFPCHDCARGLIQSGVKRIVVEQPSNERWLESSDYAKIMFLEAGVELDYLDINDNEIRNQ